MQRNKTKQLTFCATFAALGVILLYLGSIVEVVDVSMAVIASLFCVLAVIEYGKGAPWMVFLVTAVLSLLLLPNKSPAVYYAFFFGFYPILKAYFERLDKVRAWIFNEITFNVCLAVMIVLIKLLFMPSVSIPFMMYVIAVLLCEGVFVLYDIALTRLITFYMFRLRHRFKFK
jgi:hypothetical protein